MKRAFRRAGTPLACYYAVTLALPLANGAGGSAFLEHALVVFAVPPALIMLFYVARTTVVLPFRRKPPARLEIVDSALGEPDDGGPENSRPSKVRQGSWTSRAELSE